MAPDYLYETAAQGNCPALFPAGIFNYDGQTIVIWDKSGYMSPEDALKSLAGSYSGGSRGAFLDLACMVFGAALAAEDWLIPPQALDLRMERVGCDLSTKTVRFSLGSAGSLQAYKGYYSGKDLAALFELLREAFSGAVPGVPCPLEALEKRTITEDLGIRSIIKQLGLMRMR